MKAANKNNNLESKPNALCCVFFGGSCWEFLFCWNNKNKMQHSSVTITSSAALVAITLILLICHSCNTVAMVNAAPVPGFPQGIYISSVFFITKSSLF